MLKQKAKEKYQKNREINLLKRDNFTCQYCGRNVKEDHVKLEVDHIIPISKNGTDLRENLITACRDCNQGKQDVLL